MTLKQQMQDDVSTVFLDTDDFAESIRYTPDGGVATTINAVVDRRENKALTPFEVEIKQEKLISIEVATTDVSSLSIKDTFTIDSLVWLIEGSPQQDSVGLMTIELIRVQPYEKGNIRISR